MKWWVKIIAAMFILLIVTLFSYAQENTDKYLLIINSYHSESIRMDNVRNALEEKYGHHGYKIVVLSLNSPFLRNKAEANSVVNRISLQYRNRPDLIVCVGDAGLVLFQSLFNSLWKNIPVIIVYGDKTIPISVEDVIRKRNKKKYNLIDKDKLFPQAPMITLLRSSTAYEEIKMIRKLQPQLNKIIIMSDKRYSNSIIVDSLCVAIKQISPKIEVECIYSSDFSRLQLIDKLSLCDTQKNAIIYVSWSFYPQTGIDILKQRRIVDYLNVISASPIYDITDIGFVQTGSSSGGYFVLWENIRKKMLKLVDKALNGNLSNLKKYEDEGSIEKYVNFGYLKKRGINTKLIPNEAVVYGAPPTFWQKYKWMSATIACLLFSVIILLIYRELFYRKWKAHRLKDLDFLKSVLDELPIAVKVLDADHDLKFVLCNKSSERIFGTKVDAQGQADETLCSKEAMEEMENENLDVVMTGKGVSGIRSYVFADGKELFMHRDKVIVHDTDGHRLLLCSAHDVTSIQKGRMQLLDLTEKLKLAMDNAKMLFWTLNLETEEFLENDISFFGRFRDENGKLDTSKYLKSVLLGKKGEVMSYIQKMRRKEISFARTEQQIMNNGTSQWVEHIITVGQYDEYDNPIKLIGVTIDITERKNMENDLIRAKEEAEKSNRLKSAFLANMSHEIRTPLNAIIGFSTLVASAQDDEEKQQYISIVQENNNQLLQIIEDILDLSKIEAGSMDYNMKEIDLSHLFKYLEQSACLRNTNNSVIISFEKDLSPELIIKTDKNRVAQVVNNLINNAMKFTVQGSIVFGYRKEKEQVYFYVKDTGCGIPKDKLNLVFGRFVKLNNFAKGTGLGLSICESIVSHLGGTIGVDSKEGIGSNFWFRLPLSH